MGLVLTNAEELIKEVKVGGSPGCGARALAEFEILRNMVLAKSRVRTLNFNKMKFHLIKQVMREILWAAVLRDKENEQRWPLLKDTFLRTQEFSILMYFEMKQRRQEADMAE